MLSLCTRLSLLLLYFVLLTVQSLGHGTWKTRLGDTKMRGDTLRLNNMTKTAQYGDINPNDLAFILLPAMQRMSKTPASSV